MLDSETPITFTDFENFPNSPFLELDLDTSVNQNIALLLEEDFIKYEPFVYSRPSDSTFILLEAGDKLTDFKIYLKSANYKLRNENLFEFLKSNSTKTIGSYEFGEMSFSESIKPFKLTYFSTDYFIRLSYHITDSKH